LTSIVLIGQVALAAPQLRLSQTVVGPLIVATGGSTSATVEAFNTGDGTLNPQATSSVGWITVTRNAARDCGLQTGACYPFLIDVRPGTLTRGTYTGIVTISDGNAYDAPQTITVSAAVGGDIPDRIDLYAVPGQTGTARFRSSAPLQAATTTQSGGDWLAVAGEGGGSFRFGVTIPYAVTGSAASLGEGTYNGQIVTAGSSLAVENKTIPVVLRVTAQPIVQLGADRLDYRIAVGSAKQLQYIVPSNRGGGTLAVSGATAAASSGGSGWLTAERVPNSNLVGVTANPSGLAAGTYDGTVRVASNAAQGEITVPVQLVVPAAGAPLVSYNGVVNNATFEGDFLSQGMIAALFGEQFITGDPVANTSTTQLPTDLGGVRLFVNDQPAPLYYASYNQITFQVPFNAATGAVNIRVERGGTTSNRITARIIRSAPRLLRLGIGDYGIAVNQDGTFPIPPTAGIASRRARVGDTLVFYAIGVGPTAPPVASGAATPGSPLSFGVGNFRFTFGFSGPFSNAAEVVPGFVGLTPGFVGLYQINVTIPADTPTGDAVPVAMFSEDGPSNRVTIAIQ